MEMMKDSDWETNVKNGVEIFKEEILEVIMKLQYI